MDVVDPLAHLIAKQHRRIDSLLAEVLGALREGEDGAAVQAAFAAARKEIEQHLDAEDRVYYPALATLRPEQRSRLAPLVSAHAEIRARLARTQSLLAAEAVDEAEAMLAPLVVDLEEHEAAEERLLAELGGSQHAPGA